MYTQTTLLKISPKPITREELAFALLEETEQAGCYSERYMIYLEDRKMQLPKAIAVSLMKKIKDECILDGSVRFGKMEGFDYAKAHRLMMIRFGLSGMLYIGNRNRVTGLQISSKIANDPKEHRAKFVALYRQFKKKAPNLRLEPETCLTTVDCAIEDQEFLKKLFAEGNKNANNKNK